MGKFIKTKIGDFSDNILKEIAKSISDKLHCDRYGSCIHFAELFVEEVNKIDKNLLLEFWVIEGYVDWEYAWERGDTRPPQHTWIELKNGEKIDPTYVQFKGKSNYMDRIKNRYTGLEYLNIMPNDTWAKEKREKYPDLIYKV